jgi:sulfate transport system ATP-binding protein
MTSSITVENLTKRFGSFTAVDDVSFAASEGKITALLGPSGSGKSTVLRVIAGLETPDAGRIWLGREDQTRRSAQERRVGFVFQHYALFRHMSVRQNIAFGLSVRRVPRPARTKRVEELLNLVALTAFADRYPDQLSGGQRQRVALARALAPKPEVLLLDEPFGALDARVRQELRRWLDELHRELGVTSILVTHDQEEALELAHEVVVMHNGAVEQAGMPDEIYNHPASPFVAGFVGAANVLQGLVINGRVQFGEELVPGADHLNDGDWARAYVRPHDVAISSAPPTALSCAATISRMADLGWVTKVTLKLADGQRLMAQLPSEDASKLSPGEPVYADLRNAKVFTSTGSIPVSDELAGV